MRSPLTEVRRGRGPIKNRDHKSWSPCLILPKATSNNTATSSECLVDLVVENAEAVLQEAPGLQLPQSGLTEPSTAQVLESLDERLAASTNIDVATDVSDGFVFAMHHISTLIGDDMSNAASMLEERWHGEQESDDGAPVNNTTSLIALTPALSTADMSFLSFEVHDLGPSHFNDAQAADFYRMVFAPLRSTKTPAASPHFFFADYVRTRCMASHFLLAVSHSEISTFYGQAPGQSPEALQHFAIASDLFSQNLILANAQHMEMMLSFLYIYHFWLRRPAWNSQKLFTLSTAILIYVKRNDLDKMCAIQDVSALGRQSGSSSSTAAILSRILVYLFDRDGFCAFAGIGGILATHACQHEELWQKIWRVSNTAFAPASAFEGVTLSLYFELTLIHHHINCYSQNLIECPEIASDIRGRLQGLREVRSNPLLMPWS